MEKSVSNSSTMKGDKSTSRITINDDGLDMILGNIPNEPRACERLDCKHSCTGEHETSQARKPAAIRNSCISNIGINERKEMLFGGGGSGGGGGGGGKTVPLTGSDIENNNNKRNWTAKAHSSANEKDVSVSESGQKQPADSKKGQTEKGQSDETSAASSECEQKEATQLAASGENVRELDPDAPEMTDDKRPSVGDIIKLFSNRPGKRSKAAVNKPGRVSPVMKDAAAAGGAWSDKTGGRDVREGQTHPASSSKTTAPNHSLLPAKQLTDKKERSQINKRPQSTDTERTAKAGKTSGTENTPKSGRSKESSHLKAQSHTKKFESEAKDVDIVASEATNSHKDDSSHVKSNDASVTKRTVDSHSGNNDKHLSKQVRSSDSVNTSSDAGDKETQISSERRDTSDVTREEGPGGGGDDLDQRCSRLFEVFSNVTDMAREVKTTPPEDTKSKTYAKSKASPSPEQLFKHGSGSPSLGRRTIGSPSSSRRHMIAAHLRPDKFMSKINSICDDGPPQRKEEAGKRVASVSTTAHAPSGVEAAPSSDKDISISDDYRFVADHKGEKTPGGCIRGGSGTSSHQAASIGQRHVTWNVTSAADSRQEESSPSDTMLTDTDEVDGSSMMNLEAKSVLPKPAFFMDEHDHGLLGVSLDRHRAGSISVPDMATISEETDGDGSPPPDVVITPPAPSIAADTTHHSNSPSSRRRLKNTAGRDGLDANGNKLEVDAMRFELGFNANQLHPEFQLKESRLSSDDCLLSPMQEYSQSNLEPYSEDDITRLKSETARLKLDTRRQSYQVWKETYIEKPYLWRHRIAHQVVNKNMEDDWSPQRIGRINEAISWIKNELTAMRNLDQELARTLITLRHDIHHVKLQRSVAGHQEVIEDAMEAEAEKRDEPADLIVGPHDQIDPSLRSFGVTRMNISSRRFSVF